MLERSPSIRAVAIFEEICLASPGSPRACAALGARIGQTAGAQRSRPRCDLPPGTPAGPHGPVKLTYLGALGITSGWRSRASSMPMWWLGGESFVALAEGLQNARGGARATPQRDSLAARRRRGSQGKATSICLRP